MEKDHIPEEGSEADLIQSAMLFDWGKAYSEFLEYEKVHTETEEGQ